MTHAINRLVFISYSYGDEKRIASLAAHLRQTIGVRPEKAFPIVDVLEFQICDLWKNFRFVVNLDSNFDPLVLATAKFDPPEIVVRESVYQHAVIDSRPARVVLAHELGHFWLRHGRKSLKEAQLEAEYLEWQADEFAAELLMPSGIASRMAPDEIAGQFKVPPQTAKVRLETLEARRKISSADGVPRYEPFMGLLSRFERELLYWAPASLAAYPLDQISSPSQPSAPPPRTAAAARA